MTSGDRPQSENPYAPSASAAIEVETEKTAQELAKIKRQFDNEVYALGSFWFCVGVVLCFSGYLARTSLPNGPIQLLLNSDDWLEKGFPTLVTLSAIAMGFLGLAWALVGVLTLFRIERAVRIGLAINYLLLVFPAIWVSVVGILVLPLGIAQGHRVLTCMRHLAHARQNREEMKKRQDHSYLAH